jgi:hypothetical protein
LLRAPGLARKGADLVRRAVQRVPRLTEKILGAQEAALREVLRQLQSGDVEKALRRAPIAFADPDRPAAVDIGSRLSTRDPRYSLRDLVGGGSGPGAAWLGGGDVWNRLADEYRKLAKDAVRRGDYRRAAYLYGVLLRDLRSAAAALETGGLHRDAAVLYRDKLNDAAKAADLFDRAGETDEALRLYIKLDRFESAGDLCRRIGDDRAGAFYRRAAEVHAAANRFLAAGDLLRTKAGTPDAAQVCYRKGWENQSADSLACGCWVFAGLLGEKGWPAARTFLDEAEQTLAPPRIRDAEAFFRQVRSAAWDVLPEETRDEFDDRTRLFFATHLRSDPFAAGDLFAASAGWPPAVARDAIAAARRASPAESPSRTVSSPIRLVDAPVRHVAAARDSRGIALSNDQVVVFWELDTPLVLVRFVAGVTWLTVLGLATDGRGERVFLLVKSGHLARLVSFRRDGSNRFDREAENMVASPPWKSVVMTTIHGGQYVLVDVDGHREVYSPTLLPVGHSDPPPRFPDTVWMAETDTDFWSWTAGEILHTSRSDRLNPTKLYPVGRPGWRPASVHSIDWVSPHSGYLELTGVDSDWAVYWSLFVSRTKYSRTMTAPPTVKYRAACFVQPGRIAGATTEGTIQWLRPTGNELTPWADATTIPGLAPVVALVARPHAREVVAVQDDGRAVRIPIPN